MNDCVFCKIERGEIPSKKYYEDELMFIIADIEPKAEKHYLMIPKKHYKLLSDMTEEDADGALDEFARRTRKFGA